ncbi:MAG: hypothetical protein HHAS10_05850 [Candidatus Altimarinota bacterium]
MNNKLILRKELSLIQALRLIDERIKNSQTPVLVDMSEVSFPLTRDVLLVMKKRFRVDQFSLLLSYDYEVEMAHSLGIGAEKSGVRAEFDREFSKKNILAHNLSMWEYFLYELRRGMEYLKFLFTRKRSKTPIHTIKKRSPNTFLIVAGLVMSLSLLMFIFHFAVSKTYVYVVPQTTVRPISANIIFTQTPGQSGALMSQKNEVRLKKVSIPVEYSMRFAIETIDQNSATSAGGHITVYNELTIPQAMKPNTRFVSEEGIVFKTDEWINVPAARQVNGVTEIGAVEVYVKAEQLDEGGRIVGSRGNIPTGTYLSIPGLKFNREKVYAKTKENFLGGADSAVRIITKPEIEKGKAILREQLKRTARTNLDEWLKNENENNSEDYALLMGEALVLTGETIVIASGEKIGDPADEVELKGSINAYALIYDRKAVINYLAGIFREKLLLGTDKELAIHEESLRLTNIITRDENDMNIKATMEMNTTITYDLENSSNELTRRMQVMIAGLPKKEAINRLIAEGRVHEVEIKFSPFWLTRVSSNLDNIEFVIRR